MKSISVVICAYNEGRNIKPVIEESLRVLRSMAADFELIVVDDGSHDDTLESVRACAQLEPRIKLVLHAQNQGIGASLWDGFRIADKELITWLPADGQISPKDIKLFADSIGENDVVVSYYVKRPMSFLRYLTSKGVRVLLFILFGRFPRYEGTYMFRRKILKDISLIMHTSFVINYELVIRASRQGFKVIEVPTFCLERASGNSKVLGIRKIWYVFSQVLKLRFKYFK